MKVEDDELLERRRNYQNFWHVPLSKAMITDPCYCCFATWCFSCASYQLRRRALYGDMTRYVCCGGYMPCSGKVKEKKCPKFCLAAESCCCVAQSVLATRWMIQDEFNIQTTPCDNCLISFMLIVKQISDACSVLACILGSDDLKDFARILRCISNVITCVVASSMMTQHKVEMDKRDGFIDVVPLATMGAPPSQHMWRTDDAMPPPTDGIPVQPVAYGYPATPDLHAPAFAPGEPNPGLYPPGPYPLPDPGLVPPNPAELPLHVGELPPHAFNPEPSAPPNQDQPPPPPAPILGPGHPPPPQKMM